MFSLLKYTFWFTQSNCISFFILFYFWNISCEFWKCMTFLSLLPFFAHFNILLVQNDYQSHKIEKKNKNCNINRFSLISSLG